MRNRPCNDSPCNNKERSHAGNQLGSQPQNPAPHPFGVAESQNSNKRDERYERDVTYLHRHDNRQRDAALQCAVTKMLSNIGKDTPLDIFVFLPSHRLADPAFTAIQRLSSAVCLLDISERQWRTMRRPWLYSNHNNSMAQYWEKRFGPDYIIMGHWRLLVPFTITAMLNYTAALQADDDLFITQPLGHNIISTFQANNYLLANHRIVTETTLITRGLPELAAFFLQSTGYRASSTLWRHVAPGNWSGLFSKTGWRANESSTGYDNQYLEQRPFTQLRSSQNTEKAKTAPSGGPPDVTGQVSAWLAWLQYGNFVVMTMQLWRDPRVQDWITLCLLSGGMDRHRWNEQAVVALVWLLFTEPQQLWMIKDLKYIHARSRDRVQAVCAPPSPQAQGHALA
ncbi:hypothetical protein QJQ45_014760 [Haematococcus lacustris]|nr:hypothetical protein QJQ45_014760 [Haematococcus lacustris]